MKSFILSLLLTLAGLAVGGGSALYMSGLLPGAQTSSRSQIDVDGWVADFAIGTVQTDPWTRTRVARHGLLALSQSEAVYFTRTTDNTGARLTDACRYRLSGEDQDALWWSVTLYDGQSRLPMNSDEALSFDRTRAGAGSRWALLIQGAAPEEGPWISSRSAGAFDLTLRLYRPSEALLARPAAFVRPPEIERLDCQGDVP